METLAAPDPSVRRIRRWRVPPPLTRGAELLEGAEVLSEVPSEAGVILWKSLRNVMLWSASSSRDRADLFAPGAQQRRLAEIASAGIDPVLLQPLETIAAMLAAPAGAHREDISLACQRIAQWAQSRQAVATSLAFAQAAALAAPHDPRLAFAVGRLSRQRAENSRSESWFRRAIMLGRQSGDWETYALAYLGLGNLFFQRGSFPLARRAHIKGLRAARRKGHREIVGRAFHDMMAIEVESENPTRAQDYAAAALRAYGPGHARLPALAHDAAALWLLQGQFARALPVFQAVLPHLERPAERLGVLSNVARAAAGAERREIFDDAWDQVWRSIREAATAPACSTALLNLAHGASLLGQWDRAEEAAIRAEQIAATRGESQIRFEADALLDAIRHRRTLAARLRGASTCADSTPDQRADLLAVKLVESVSRRPVGV